MSGFIQLHKIINETPHCKCCRKSDHRALDFDKGVNTFPLCLRTELKMVSKLEVVELTVCF